MDCLLPFQINAPIAPHKVRHDLGPCPFIRPFENLGRLGGFRAEPFPIHADGDPTQIQTISIPASLDRDIGLGLAIGMTGTGFVEKLEFVVGKNEPLITQDQGKVAATFTMPRIGAIAHTAGIVEDSEKLHDFDIGLGLSGQPKTVLQNSRPVADTVGTMPGQKIVLENPVNKGFEIEHGPAYRLFGSIDVSCLPQRKPRASRRRIFSLSSFPHFFRFRWLKTQRPSAGFGW